MAISREAGAPHLSMPGFSFHGGRIGWMCRSCYEIHLLGRVVDEADGPSFLFKSFQRCCLARGTSSAPGPSAAARDREGIAVLRARPNGISALISPEGRLVSTLRAVLRGVIDIHTGAAAPTLF